MSSDLSDNYIDNENKNGINNSRQSDFVSDGEGCSQVLYDAVFYMVFDPLLLLI